MRWFALFHMISLTFNFFLCCLLNGSFLAYGQHLQCKEQVDLSQEEDSAPLLQTKIAHQEVDNQTIGSSQDVRFHAQPLASEQEVATRFKWSSFASVGGLNEQPTWHAYLTTLTKKFAFKLGSKLAEDTPNIALLDESVRKTGLKDPPHWDVVAITVVLLLVLSVILVRLLHQKHNSPIVMAVLSCTFFGVDNFLIAYAGTYLRLPNAHMAVMFFFIGFFALILHVVLAAMSATYKAQIWTMLRSTKLIIVCIALTALLVDMAEVCSNIGFSLDLPSSGPYQALASCNVLIVCPFFYYFYGERLTRSQLFGIALLISGAVFLSDASQWGHHNISIYGFSWLVLSMLFYAISDITLRFTCIVGLAWQPRVMLMLFVMGTTGFPMYFMDREENGFKEFHQSPSLFIWPALNAVAGMLGLLSCTVAFEAPEAPCGVLSAIVNANSVVLVLLNKAILGYQPSSAKIVGMVFITVGVSMFHVSEGFGSKSENAEPCEEVATLWQG